MTTEDTRSTWIRDNLFDTMPLPAAVIDADFNLTAVNKAFSETFGEWQGKKCYTVFRNLADQCPDCRHKVVFETGETQSFEDICQDPDGGQQCRINHIIPIKAADGTVSEVVEIVTAVPCDGLIRQKADNLFEHVPFDIMIINRDFKIVDANLKSREKFGSIEGRYCYEVLKNRTSQCTDCAAMYTFKDGEMHTGQSRVINQDGERAELLVTTVPYAVKDGQFDHILEMAVDITQTLELQEELKMTNVTMRSLISSSLYGIIAVDENDHITIVNQAAERMLNIRDPHRFEKRDLEIVFPKGFLEFVSASSGPIYLHETKVANIDGDPFPARLTGIKLLANNQYKGMAFWIHDIRRIKKLEAEKLEAERLAAVGKTVAGLAHGIKNVLTGLEGGEYMLNSGLQKGDASRIAKGLEMLNRNTKRVSTFVKEFLNYSKGEEIEAALCDPVEIAREVVNNYFIKIKQLGIQLITDFDENIGPANMDAEGMHESLSNLLGNAIDACRISETVDQLRIIFKVIELDNAIVYEVIDNGCGMDYEVKKKVFTTFFTTKGLGGTGLGLLMTKKIVQQHGGEVGFDSILDQGTTFRITLPRDRLPSLPTNGMMA